MLKHPSLPFLLEGQMVVHNQVGAVKSIIIPLPEKSYLGQFKAPAGDWRCPV